MRLRAGKQALERLTSGYRRGSVQRLGLGLDNAGRVASLYDDFRRRVDDAANKIMAAGQED